MSVFKGRITEIPGVIIDHFPASNCKYGRAFFLSHCHKDHMTGLSSEELVTTLRGRNCTLYCSEMTKALLEVEDEFRHLVSYLKSLVIEEPVLISLPAHQNLSITSPKKVTCSIFSNQNSNPLQVTVTLLPAGHCPGSVMFLLQDDSHSVLYTGDFRLQAEDIMHNPTLHCSGRLVDLDSLYLDTTFCHPKAAEIPTREESRDVVLQLMDEWLNKSLRHVVHLKLFMVGFEHVILGIYEKFGTKVHVSGNKVRCYNQIDAVGDCVTADGSKTRIHACIPMKGKRYGSGLPCGAFTNEKEGHPKVMNIKLSAQWFLLQPAVPKSSCVHFPRHNLYRVFHSMHASYNEIRSFVGYLRPRTIIPCVIALNDKCPMDVYSRLKDLLRADGNVDSDIKTCDRNSPGSLPNKDISADHTNWMSGDETDSDWASSPVKYHGNGAAPESLVGFTMRKHAGTKRSLFSLDESSEEQLIKRSLDNETDDDDHQTSIELSSYSLSDSNSHGNIGSQPYTLTQDPVTSSESNPPTLKTIPYCSTPLKEEESCLSLQTPLIHNTDFSPRKDCSLSSPVINTPSKTSPHLSKSCCGDVIDLTQSDDDSDITYCSDAEDSHVFIDSEASLNPTSCHSPLSQPPASDRCVVLPATPEHSTVRTTSIILSYHGVI